ncbi:MAG: DegV family protein [Anaerolineae bacterium]|nr:DegV family protein [Anaerolineae bacterium]
MSKIAIITDTDSSLPDNVAKRYGIRQVPINIYFGEDEFKAGVEIDDSTLFLIINREKTLPTTSAPTPGQFAAAFKEAFDDGAESIACFCVSSEMSATHKSAMAAREVYPDRTIEVIDSRATSMVQGFMSIAAVEAIQNGASLDKAIQHAIAVRDHSHMYAAVATLKYLAMSGRVGHLAAGMGDMLNIKPILTLKDGKLEMLEKVRTRGKAWTRLIELTERVAQNTVIERMAIVHADALNEAREFLELLQRKIICPKDIITTELTPGLSVHAGSGVVGLVFVTA